MLIQFYLNKNMEKNVLTNQLALAQHYLKISEFQENHSTGIIFVVAICYIVAHHPQSDIRSSFDEEGSVDVLVCLTYQLHSIRLIRLFFYRIYVYLCFYFFRCVLYLYTYIFVSNYLFYTYVLYSTLSNYFKEKVYIDIYYYY